MKDPAEPFSHDTARQGVRDLISIVTAFEDSEHNGQILRSCIGEIIHDPLRALSFGLSAAGLIASLFDVLEESMGLKREEVLQKYGVDVENWWPDVQ